MSGAGPRRDDLRRAPRDDLRRGALLLLGATLMFTLLGGLVKEVTQRLSLVEAMFFRNAAALPVVLLIALRPGRGGGGGVGGGVVARAAGLLRTRRFPGHLGRAGTGLMAMGCSFYPLTVMPLADQTVLTFTTPLFVVLLAIPFLGERPSRRRWLAVAVGFAGVLVVAVGQGALASGSAPAHAWAIGAAQGFFAGLTTLLVRRLSATEGSGTIVLWQSLLMASALGLLLPLFWVAPTPREWLLLLGIGALGGIGQLLQTEAYASAPVSALGPYSYASLLWAMLIGWLFFADAPGPAMLLGAALVVGAGLAVLPGDLRAGAAAARAAAEAEEERRS